jgi:hypothetical protein
MSSGTSTLVIHAWDGNATVEAVASLGFILSFACALFVIIHGNMVEASKHINMLNTCMFSSLLLFNGVIIYVSAPLQHCLQQSIC